MSLGIVGHLHLLPKFSTGKQQPSYSIVIDHLSQNILAVLVCHRLESINEQLTHFLFQRHFLHLPVYPFPAGFRVVYPAQERRLLRKETSRDQTSTQYTPQNPFFHSTLSVLIFLHLDNHTPDKCRTFSHLLYRHLYSVKILIKLRTFKEGMRMSA